jgi:hypothetical protein
MVRGKRLSLKESKGEGNLPIKVACSNVDPREKDLNRKEHQSLEPRRIPIYLPDKHRFYVKAGRIYRIIE